MTNRLTAQAAPANTLPARATGAGFGQFFAYHGWLSPGIRLFRQISFPAKAACVALAFGLPLAMLLAFVATAAHEQISFTQAERQGLTVARPLIELANAAQLRRRATSQQPAGELDAVQDRVRRAFEQVQAQAAVVGNTLGLGDQFNRLRQAHEALNRTLAQPTAAAPDDERFQAQTAFIAQVLALTLDVADRSQLTRDPELETHHLMNMAVLRLPMQLENIGRLQAMGTLALQSQQLSPQRLAWLNRWSAVQETIDAEVAHAYQAVATQAPEVEALFGMKALNQAVAAFERAIGAQLLQPALGNEAAAFRTLGDAAITGLAAMNQLALNRLDTLLQARITQLQRTLALQLGVSALFMLVAGYLMMSFYRVMMGGLQEVSGHLKQITLGNLTTAPQPWGRDEAAQLMLTLGEMQVSLRRIAGSVRDGAAQVQLASREIASAALDLSQRTVQTAASLEETAASMAQIGTAVTQTADTVAGASAIVRGNASTAARGGAVIDAVVQTMDGIQRSSNRIGEIIGTIDGIAFQTNILALNAAVEAARAGEQGRGFAVVAAEVRALAGRSSAAAREIKTLISASLAEVANGSRVAADAGATMGEIVATADQMAGLMDTIAQASVEQTAGVGQVGRAVQLLDQSTHQNAALVEQTSAAAQALSDQAQRLVVEVSFFKVV